jgi:hypothetical protein
MSNGLQYLSVSRKTKTVLNVGCANLITPLSCFGMQFGNLRIIHSFYNLEMLTFLFCLLSKLPRGASFFMQKLY